MVFGRTLHKEKLLAVIIRRVEIQSFAAVDDGVGRNVVVAAVPRNDAVVCQVLKLIPCHSIVCRKAEPDAIEGIGDMVIINFVVAAKGEFNRVIEGAADGVALNGIPVAAGSAVGFDKDAVPVRAGDGVVLNEVAAGTGLKHDATCIAAGTHRAVTPGAISQIITCGIVGNLTVLHIVEMDAPRGIAVGGIAAHGELAGIANINADGAVVGMIVANQCVGRGTDAHPAPFG